MANCAKLLEIKDLTGVIICVRIVALGRLPGLFYASRKRTQPTVICWLPSSWSRLA